MFIFFMSNFFSRIFRLFLILIVLAISIIFLSAVAYFKNVGKNHGSEIKQEEKTNLISDFSGLKRGNFTWKYNSVAYSVSPDLYQSVHAFYQNRPKVFKYHSENLPAGWKEQYFGMFLAPAENDKVFLEIAGSIREQGQKNKLTDDQIVELALAFVQSIPYDDERAKIILDASRENKNNDALPKYPYETVYEKKGVCSDKSFLAAILIRELGYGATLFEYSDANHMAIGIECPIEYSTDNTGYCYAETTAPGHRIGIIPQLDNMSKAVPRKELSYFSAESENGPEGKPLVNPAIYQKTSGKIYQTVISTYKIQKELSRLDGVLAGMRSQLKTMRKNLVSIEEQIKDLDDKMDDHKRDKKYDEYNDSIPKYNSLVKDYKKKVKDYNAKVGEYNDTVNYYNKLIKEFSITE